MYRMVKASGKFKKRFPKKFTFAIIVGSKTITANTDSLPLVIYLPFVRGYVFTYHDKVDLDIGINYPIDIDNSTYPECLDTYFGGKSDIDLILKCKPKTSHIVSPAFSSEIIIRTDSHELMKTNSIGAYVMETINENLNSFNNVEDWVDFIITNCPLDNELNPIRFPNVINKSTLNAKVLKRDVFITYDYRPSNITNRGYSDENKLITKIEDEFESPSLKLTIADSYNNLSMRIKKELDKKRLAYKYNSVDKSITVSLKNLRQLDMTYDLVDFI